MTTPRPAWLNEFQRIEVRADDGTLIGARYQRRRNDQDHAGPDAQRTPEEGNPPSGAPGAKEERVK